MNFNPNIILIPGLYNSGENHWQSIWERKFNFKRIHQANWETPEKDVWINTIDEFLKNENLTETILVGHSLACATIVFWAEKFKRGIKGAMLVAPSDTEAENYPKGTVGFSPMPLYRLPFKSIVVSSDNDEYVSTERAKHFAKSWGSEIISIGNASHINTASGHGEWSEGLQILHQLSMHQR